MSFSKENRKDVFDFFVKVLLTKGEPIYYEQLRGHVSQAYPDVRKYVQKKCKGEKLLEYFQKRKNYFIVDQQQHVALKKRFKQYALKQSLKSENMDDFDDEYSEEINDNEYSKYYNKNDRSDSFVSSCQSKFDSTDDDQSSCSDFNKDMTEYEEITMDHFKKYLTRNETLNLHNVEFASFPKKVQRYLTRNMKKNVILFFQTYPNIFHVDDYCVRLAGDSIVKEASILPEQKTSPDVEEFKQSMNKLNFKEQSVENFLRCADYFVSLLKKKATPICVDKLSGHLSQAPKEITAYLKHNYKYFKYFLLTAPKLFIFNEQDEVSLSADSSKLLKRVKKRLKMQDECLSVSVTTVIKSFFEHSVKKCEIPEVDQTCINVSDIRKLECADQKRTMNVKSVVSTVSNNSVSEMHIDTRSISVLGEIQVNLPDLSLAITDDDKICKTQSLDIFVSQSSDKFDVISNSEELSSMPMSSSKLEESDSCILEQNTKLEKTQKCFKECLHTVQLMCLEIVDKELHLSLKFECEAVEFFIKILKNFPGRWCEISTLQGNLGQAHRDIISFMNTLYKGEKFEEFFEERKEFVVHSDWRVELSLNFQDHFDDRLHRQETFTHTKKYFLDLCDSYWNNMCINFFEGLHTIFSFLQNKKAAKISRLSGRMANFPPLLKNFINTLNAKDQIEKIKQFLGYFNFFTFTNECVSLDPGIIICSAMDNLRKYVQRLPKNVSETSKLCIIDDSLYKSKDFKEDSSFKELCDLKINIINCAKDNMSYTSPVTYSHLLKILNTDLFHNFDALNLEFLDLIIILFESNLFQVGNGEICLKKLDVNETEILDKSDFIKYDDAVLSSNDNNTKDDLENSAVEEIFYKEKINQDNEVCIENYEICCDKIFLNNIQVEALEICTNDEILYQDTLNKSCELEVRKNKLYDETVENNSSCLKKNVVENCSVNEEKNEDSVLEFESNTLFNEFVSNNFINEAKERVLEDTSDDKTFNKEKINQDFELKFANNRSSYNSKVNSDLILVTDQNKVGVFENTNEKINVCIESSCSSSDAASTNNEVSNSLVTNTDCDITNNSNIIIKDEMSDVSKQYMDINFESNSTNHLPTNLSSENIEGDYENIEYSCSSCNDTDMNNKVSHFLITSNRSEVTSSCSIDPKEDMVDDNKQYKNLNFRSISTNDLSSENIGTYAPDKSDTNDNFNEPPSVSCSLKDIMDDNKQYNSLNYESSSINHVPVNLSSDNFKAYDDIPDKSNANDNFSTSSSVSSSMEYVKDSDDIIPYNSSSDNLKNDVNALNSSIGVRHFIKFVASSSVIFLYPPTPLAYVNNYKEFIHDNLSSDYLENCKSLLKSNANDKSLVDEDTINFYKLHKSDSAFDSKENAIELDLKIFNENVAYSKEDIYSNSKLNDVSEMIMPDLLESSSFVNSDESNASEKSNNDETYDVGLFFNIFTSYEESLFSPATEVKGNSLCEYNEQNIQLSKYDDSLFKTDVSTCGKQTLDVKTEAINVKETQFTSHIKDRPTTNEAFDVYRYVCELENVDMLHSNEIENHDQNCVLKSQEMHQDSKINVTNLSRQLDLSQDNEFKFIESSIDHCSFESECSVVISSSNVVNNESGSTQPHNNKVLGASDKILHSSSVEGQHTKYNKLKHDLSETHVAKQNSTFFGMQPLSGKVILLSTDCCIVETVLHRQVKLVFCFKSSFHCDQHNNCIKCFESLKIGDRVSCYIHPTENSSNFHNMYFSFLLSKESTSEIENPAEICQLESKKLCKRYQVPLYDNENDSDNACDSPTLKTFPDYLEHKIYESKFCQANLTNDAQPYSYTSKNSCLQKSQTFSQSIQTKLSGRVFQHCPSVEKECQVTYSMNSQNCQTDLSGNIKICCSVVEKECQAKCSQLSQTTQTFCEASQSGCQTELSGQVKLCPSAVEKECQAKCSVISQNIQTVCKSNESSSQTELSGNIRLSLPVLQKDCQTHCSTSTRETQTFNKNIDSESQTNISGSVKCCFNSSSLACQTVLSGHVKKCVSLANKSCQSLSISRLDESRSSPHTFSTPKSGIELPSFNSHIDDFQSFECSNRENATMEEFISTEEYSKELCDTASQTISTGAIMIKKYFL